MGQWEWVLAFLVCWSANIYTVAHHPGPLPWLLFGVCRDHKVQGLKHARFSRSPAEFYHLRQVEVVGRQQTGRLGCGFSFQKTYVHLERREWPENRARSGFILFRYFKCFSLVENNLFLV